MQKKYILIALVVAVAFVFGACGAEPAEPVFSPEETAKKNISAVTLENYEKIENGMSLAQVEDILGKGNLSANIGEASIFSWPGGGFSSISVTFTDNEVSSKMQIGLGGDEEAALPVAAQNSSLNRKNYEKIENGMSLREVEELLGPGKEHVSGDQLVSYSWAEDSMHAITVVFKDNKVVSKFQIGL